MKNFYCTALFLLFTIFGFAKTIDVSSGPPIVDFVTKWKTTTANESIIIPMSGISFQINWGDGQTEGIGNASLGVHNPSHTYAVAGIYTVTISGWYFDINNLAGGALNATKLLSVDNWGSNAWTTMKDAFSGCSNLVINATDVPNLTNVTDMSSMFMGCISFNQVISNWNVSNVTNMNSMFRSASLFNQDLSTWDVSKVTDMAWMFGYAAAFNQPIGNWNVRNVTNMSLMFSNATTFNQDISSWNVSKVYSIGGMFADATAFNQPIGSWNVISVWDMSSTFMNASSFNQDIRSWSVSNVIDMDFMFQNASSFNQNIGSWNVSKVEFMFSMFNGVTLSVANYDALLMGWSVQTLKPNVNFNGGNSKYFSSAVAVARQSILATYGWTITDGGELVVPTITSFSPESAAIGATVTITGTNFDLIADNNIVKFGATRATVTAASTTSLTVIVPVGTTYKFITVLNQTLGLIASSVKPFIATFTPNKGGITYQDIMAKVDLAANTKSISVAIGDLDGDGKADLAVVNKTSISVYHNISSAGSIGQASFAAKVDFSVSGACTTLSSIAIGDLDGDGKLDMAVANQGCSSGSVFRNTSTTGSIDANSFAPTVYAPTGTYPLSVAIGDLDGDGKMDLAFANFSDDTVSVLHNTSSSGNLSFESKVVFPSGSQPRSVAIGDIDGDGKPELVIANASSFFSSVSVLHNTSVIKTIDISSFGTKVDLVSGLAPYSVAIGDLDGDGKSDLAVANTGDSTVSVYRNSSSLGTIDTNSFQAKQDFATGANPRSVAIGDLDGDGKVDLAVANYGNATVSLLRNTASSGSITSASFASNVDFTTGIQPQSVAIGDLDGDGKADLALANWGSATASVLRNSSLESLNTTDFSTINLNFYPNPVKEFLTISLDKARTIKGFEIYDISGKRVDFKTNYNSNRINVSGFSNGLYLLKVQTDLEMLTAKFIKE